MSGVGYPDGRRGKLYILRPFIGELPTIVFICTLFRVTRGDPGVSVHLQTYLNQSSVCVGCWSIPSLRTAPSEGWPSVFTTETSVTMMRQSKIRQSLCYQRRVQSVKLQRGRSGDYSLSEKVVSSFLFGHSAMCGKQPCISLQTLSLAASCRANDSPQAFDGTCPTAILVSVGLDGSPMDALECKDSIKPPSLTGSTLKHAKNK